MEGINTSIALFAASTLCTVAFLFTKKKSSKISTPPVTTAVVQEKEEALYTPNCEAKEESNLREDQNQKLESEGKVETDDSWEVRGVSLALLKSVANLARERDPNAEWTIGRIGSVLVGNHEILKPQHRWGDINPESTLTYESKSSLIELLRKDWYSVPHPVLQVSYEGNVAIANKFISFAYSSNFLELVDCLEQFFTDNKDTESPENTFFWFDVLVNNQWIAAEKSFDWWATTFRTAVRNIGHTILFLSPWESPVILTRAWCLFEIACSEHFTCLLSKNSEIDLWGTIGEDTYRVVSSLCDIDVEKSQTFLQSDRDRIFEVVRSLEGQFYKINLIISDKIRNWLFRSIEKGYRFFFNRYGSESPITLAFGTRIASIYYMFQNYEKCQYYYEQVYEKSKKVHGNYHLTTIGATIGMAIIENLHGNHFKAIEFYHEAIQFSEECLKQEESAVLTATSIEVTTPPPSSASSSSSPSLEERNRALLKSQQTAIYGNLGSVYIKLIQFDKAKAYLERSLQIHEQNKMPADLAYYNTLEILASVYRHLDDPDKAERNYELVLNGLESLCGTDHLQYLRTCLNYANYMKEQKLYDTAKLYYDKAFLGSTKALGFETDMFALILRNYGLFYLEINNLVEAKKLLLQSYEAYQTLQQKQSNEELLNRKEDGEEVAHAFYYYLQVIEKLEGPQAVKELYEEEFRKRQILSLSDIGEVFDDSKDDNWSSATILLLSRYGVLCIRLNEWEKAEQVFELTIKIRYRLSQNTTIAMDKMPDNPFSNELKSKMQQSVPSFFSASLKKGKHFTWSIDFIHAFLSNYRKSNTLLISSGSITTTTGRRSTLTIDEVNAKNFYYTQLFYQSCIDIFGFDNQLESYYSCIQYALSLIYYKLLDIQKVHEILLLYEISLNGIISNYGDEHDLSLSFRFLFGTLLIQYYNKDSSLLEKALYHSQLAYELYEKKVGSKDSSTIAALFYVASVQTLQNKVVQCFQSWLQCSLYRYDYYLTQRAQNMKEPQLLPESMAPGTEGAIISPGTHHHEQQEPEDEKVDESSEGFSDLIRELDMFCKVVNHLSEATHYELLPTCLKGIEMLINVGTKVKKVEKYLPFIAQLTYVAAGMVPHMRENTKKRLLSETSVATTEEEQKEQEARLSATLSEIPDELTVFLLCQPAFNIVKAIPIHTFIATYYTKIGSHYLNALKDPNGARLYLKQAYLIQTELSRQQRAATKAEMQIDHRLSDTKVFPSRWQYFECLAELPSTTNDDEGNEIIHEKLQTLGDLILSIFFLPQSQYDLIYSEIAQLNLQIAQNTPATTVKNVAILEAWCGNIIKQFEEIKQQLQQLQGQMQPTTVADESANNVVNDNAITITLKRLQKMYEFLFQSHYNLGMKLKSSSVSLYPEIKDGNLMKGSNYLRKAFQFVTIYHGKEHSLTIQTMFQLVNVLKAITNHPDFKIFRMELCDNYLKDYLPFFHQKYCIEKNMNYENYYYSSLLILGGTSATINRLQDVIQAGKDIFHFIYFHSSRHYYQYLDDIIVVDEVTAKEKKEQADQKVKEVEQILIQYNQLIRLSYIQFCQFQVAKSFYEQFRSTLSNYEEQQQEQLREQRKEIHEKKISGDDQVSNKSDDKTDERIEATVEVPITSSESFISKKYEFFYKTLYLPSIEMIEKEEQVYQSICQSYPLSVHHESHPSHPLLLVRCSYASGRFSCDLCGKDGEGFVFHCKECGYDLHLTCGCPKSDSNSSHDSKEAEEGKEN